eukprot:COSAG02_NODE_34322_length_485_cov_378.059585_1_plen_50_part_01
MRLNDTYDEYWYIEIFCRLRKDYAQKRWGDLQRQQVGQQNKLGDLLEGVT